jgi:hypothetical protein
MHVCAAWGPHCELKNVRWQAKFHVQIGLAPTGVLNTYMGVVGNKTGDSQSGSSKSEFQISEHLLQRNTCVSTYTVEATSKYTQHIN